MIEVRIDGKPFSKESITEWEQNKTEKTVRFLKKRIPMNREICNADELADWKASLPEETMRKAIAKLNALCAWITGIAVRLSNGKRKISIAEIDIDFADAKTIYNLFMETMIQNTPENLRCNLRANPEHFVLKGIDEHTQEVIEISGGIPFPEQFFIRYGDEEGLVSKAEADYPYQASGVAFLKNGMKIGGVRHQMKDNENGCRIKLMVEFPSIMPDANIRAHQYHLACEFYNWFRSFEKRLCDE